MKKIRCTILLCFIFAGCIEQPVATTIALSRTWRMDDSTLYVDGDRWILEIPGSSGKSYIVGSDVAFVEKRADHIVVNLDQTESEKASRRTLGSHTLLKIPTSSEHSVLLVTTHGYTAVQMEQSDSAQLPVLLSLIVSGVSSDTDNRSFEARMK
ncbi:hypothetical protein SH449x_004909 [Pirellulaceae bacterium SH449]